MARKRQSHQTSLIPFFTIWTGQAFSLMGSSLVQFALIWYLTVSTGSATVLALASLVGMLPQIVISPIAGALVDRWNRRTVMIAADSLIAVSTTILAGLFAIGVTEVWHIYTLLMIRSLGSAFHWPAMQATTPLMVSEEYLSRVGGMNQALLGVASVLTPPLGALLLGLLPMQAILAIDVFTALIAIGPLLLIFIPQPKKAPASSDGAANARSAPSVLEDVGEGLRFLWHWPGMLMITGIAMVIRLLVGPGVALLPLLVTNHFGGEALQLAWLQAASGIGLIIGGIILSVWGGFQRRIVTALLALVLDGIAIALIGLSPADGLLLALFALFSAGLVEPFVHGSMAAIFQAKVPPHLQGRIFAMLTAMGSAIGPLGLAIAGPVADALGVQFWFIVGGFTTTLMGVVAFFIPAILHIEDQNNVFKSECASVASSSITGED